MPPFSQPQVDIERVRTVATIRRVIVTPEGAAPGSAAASYSTAPRINRCATRPWALGTGAVDAEDILTGRFSMERAGAAGRKAGE